MLSYCGTAPCRRTVGTVDWPGSGSPRPTGECRCVAWRTYCRCMSSACWSWNPGDNRLMIDAAGWTSLHACTIQHSQRRFLNIFLLLFTNPTRKINNYGDKNKPLLSESVCLKCGLYYGGEGIKTMQKMKGGRRNMPTCIVAVVLSV